MSRVPVAEGAGLDRPADTLAAGVGHDVPPLPAAYEAAGPRGRSQNKTSRHA
ncbi:MAG TPA: hypothetical protein VNV37_10900 [Solirubrobacteraceae bacterium]|nr:hypothetical protein [Solirubrobacteraceae bacterium]